MSGKRNKKNKEINLPIYYYLPSREIRYISYTPHHTLKRNKNNVTMVTLKSEITVVTD